MLLNFYTVILTDFNFVVCQKPIVVVEQLTLLNVWTFIERLLHVYMYNLESRYWRSNLCVVFPAILLYLFLLLCQIVIMSL